MNAHPIVLTLPITPGQNESLRTHWAVRKRARDTLAWNIAAELGRQRPAVPIEHATIEITRYYAGHPLDEDNLSAAAKHILDVLQPYSPKHPAGLGVISGDDPDHLTLTLRQAPAGRRSMARTVVTIRAPVPLPVPTTPLPA